MFNKRVAVMSQYLAEKYAFEKHDERSVVISITSYGSSDAIIIPNKVNGIIDVLHLHFNDTDSRDIADGGIDESIAMEIKRFLEKYANNPEIDLIIVHCEAGQSRSAGVAGAILKKYTNDDMQIFGDKRYSPNMLVYRTVLNKLME